MPNAEIGAALREARMRARIDVSEIEAQTKIRAKYLRALENEEWDLLPGPTFVKSFLRTYAQALHLDDKALLEEYRQHYERPNEADLQPIVPSAHQRPQAARGPARSGQRSGGRAGGVPRGIATPPSRGYTIAIALVSLVIVLLVVALLTGGSSDKNPTSARSTTTSRRHTGAPARTGGATVTNTSPLHTLTLKPTAPVYVCLLSATGRKLIPGLILQPGSPQPMYRSHTFTITLGNSGVVMYVDGHERTVPPSSQAIGYRIAKDGARQPLQAGELPTCR